MNKNWAWIVVAIIILVLGFWYYFYSDNEREDTTPLAQDSIESCYVAKLEQDVYTLKIEDESSGVVQGKLSFKNFEKDSSSGTFQGSYEEEILLADYSFQSEGMDSVMEVIFKKEGDTFIRGFGSLNSDGTKFTDLSKITYDSKQTFILTNNCPI